MADQHPSEDIQHPSEDMMVDLALSDIDDPGREGLNRHLAQCEPCRVACAAVAESIDGILVAAPSVAPPAGFSGSVLAAMRMGSADPGVPGVAVRAPRASEPGSAQRRRRPRHLVTALAAVLALLLGAGGTAWVMRASQEPVATVAVGSALLTSVGSRVGTVQTSWHEQDPVLVVTVTDGQVGTRYECFMVLADGTRQSGGYWVLREQAGATWVVTRPKAAVTGVELVTDSGTWASAQL